MTGNRPELTATGTLVGNGVKYGDNGALTLSTDYTVTRARSRSLERRTVDADTQGHVRDRRRPEHQRADGEDDLRQTASVDVRRDGEAAATHADRRRVAGAASRSSGSASRAARARDAGPAVAARARVASRPSATANDVVDGRTISSSSAAISRSPRDGTFGRAGDALKVTLDQRRSRQRRCAAAPAAAVHGPRQRASGRSPARREAPAVDGRLPGQQGRLPPVPVRHVSAARSITRGTGMTLDTKLQQNATQWITAKGYVPVAAVQRGRAAANRRRTHEALELPAIASICTIDSSPIDLGRRPGLHDRADRRHGHARGARRVTGPADDPHPDGVGRRFRTAPFTVVPTGVALHRASTGAIDLQPDRVHIDQHHACSTTRQKPLS